MARRIAVIMATHNRVSSTLKCIETLLREKPSNWVIDIYVVDSGSTDGTVEAILKSGGVKKVTQGPDDWFWAKAMFEAHNSIDGDFDYILWLNDDVLILPGALTRLDHLASQRPDEILVGAMRDTLDSKCTYGGFKRLGRHPFKYSRVVPTDSPQVVDTFNGNLVLIPRKVIATIGVIDGGFKSQKYGDIDYGLRAKKKGITSLLAPGYVGICSENPAPCVPDSAWERWKAMTGPKGLPIKSQVRFLKRHGGFLWPQYLIPPIIRLVFVPHYGRKN